MMVSVELFGRTTGWFLCKGSHGMSPVVDKYKDYFAKIHSFDLKIKMNGLIRKCKCAMDERVIE
jgi:hypothetical protein